MKKLALALSLAVLACDSPTDATPWGEVVLGAFSVDGRAPVFTVPDTVAVGTDFGFGVRTYGASCFVKHRTDLSVTGLRATVTPYDVTRGSPTCNGTFGAHDHVVRLGFDRVGTAIVTVKGRRSFYRDDVILVERAVVIR